MEPLLIQNVVRSIAPPGPALNCHLGKRCARWGVFDVRRPRIIITVPAAKATPKAPAKRKKAAAPKAPAKRKAPKKD